MATPRQRTRIIAGTPIQAGDRRLLPSVLVTTLEGSTQPTPFRFVRMRPISVVEESGEGARWHAVPNSTADALSSMAAVGLGVAAVSVGIIVLSWFLRGNQ